ncbi:MAG: hypothetical protein AAF959_22750 [Cyanobacteria bacterium P01_D01_bin.56]
MTKYTHSKIEIWNILHDAFISEINGKIPGDLCLKVEIEYLCELLSPDSSALWIYLNDCQRFEYTPYSQEEAINDIQQIQSLELGILSTTDEEKAETIVCCDDGLLHMAYADISCQLDNGTPLTVEQLQAVSKTYWQNFGTGHPEESVPSPVLRDQRSRK